MIWPNLRIGSPVSMRAVAILWPRGTRSTARRRAGGRVAGSDFVDARS